MIVGFILMVGVAGSVGQIAEAVRLSSDLAASEELAIAGGYEGSADRALSVLTEEPLSLRAAHLFACSGWRARRFDEVATLVNRYSKVGLTVEVVDKCTSSLPMTGLVTTLAAVAGRGDSTFLVVRDQREAPSRPTSSEAISMIRELGRSKDGLALGLLIQAAFICHNRAAGFSGLARDQLGDLRDAIAASAGLDPSADPTPRSVNTVLSWLPRSWGCDSDASFYND